MRVLVVAQSCLEVGYRLGFGLGRVQVEGLDELRYLLRGYVAGCLSDHPDRQLGALGGGWVSEAWAILFSIDDPLLTSISNLRKERRNDLNTCRHC